MPSIYDEMIDVITERAKNIRDNSSSDVAVASLPFPVDEEMLSKIFELTYVDFNKFTLRLHMNLRMLFARMSPARLSSMSLLEIYNLDSLSYNPKALPWSADGANDFINPATRAVYDVDKMAGIPRINSLANPAMYGFYKSTWHEGDLLKCYRDKATKIMDAHRLSIRIPTAAIAIASAREAPLSSKQRQPDFKIVASGKKFSMKHVFYIVTETTDDFRIGDIEEFNFAKHSKVSVNEDSLNGLLINPYSSTIIVDGLNKLDIPTMKFLGIEYEY